MSTLKVYNPATSQWEYLALGKTGPQGDPGRFTASDTAPTSPTEGDAWYCTLSTGDLAGKEFIYYDSYWIEMNSGKVGPQGPVGPTGATGPTGPAGGTGKMIAMAMIFGG